MISEKSEKCNDDFSNDERDNFLSLYKLISISSECSDIREEIKSLQRSNALLRQDITYIIRSELLRLKGNEY